MALRAGFGAAPAARRPRRPAPTRPGRRRARAAAGRRRRSARRCSPRMASTSRTRARDRCDVEPDERRRRGTRARRATPKSSQVTAILLPTSWRAARAPRRRNGNDRQSGRVLAIGRDVDVDAVQLSESAPASSIAASVRPPGRARGRGESDRGRGWPRDSGRASRRQS